MELAIKEMKKSLSEHSNKSDPLVGAILVDENGKILGKAHRGNLRVGDHAEFTLIERLLGNKKLDSSTLYVTLEPCIVRNPPKIACAKRIVSARIKNVYIGIPDPNPNIEGKGISYLINNGVKVNFFENDLSKIIRDENKDFIEQFEGNEDSHIEYPEESELPSRKENEIIESASVNDFSHEEIKKYLKKCKRTYKVPSNDLWNFFYRNGFLVKDSSKNIYIPTVAGILLFGKNPNDFFPQCIIKMQAKYGEKAVLEDIEDSLFNVPKKIKSFLDKNMKTYMKISTSGFERIEVPEYPWEALREAIINAIVHRDYEGGRRIMINLFMDRIEIKSPGLPMLPLTLEKIRNYNTSPYNRNPRIAYAFSKMKLMEERGIGLELMRDYLIKNGLQPPKFNFENNYFVVKFLSPLGSPEEFKISKDILLKLNNRQKNAISLIQNKIKINSVDYAEELGIHQRTALRDLNKLIDLGIIEAKGRGKNIYYTLRRD